MTSPGAAAAPASGNPRFGDSGTSGREIRTCPDAYGRVSDDTWAMNTVLTVVAIAVVVVVLAIALWVFVVAPLWVPTHSRRS